MSGYCPDCGNVMCLCEEIDLEKSSPMHQFNQNNIYLEQVRLRSDLIKCLIQHNIDADWILTNIDRLLPTYFFISETSGVKNE